MLLDSARPAAWLRVRIGRAAIRVILHDGGQHLDGDLAAQGLIRGLLDDFAHAAFTDPRRERVVQECLPGVQHGLGSGGVVPAARATTEAIVFVDVPS